MTNWDAMREAATKVLTEGTEEVPWHRWDESLEVMGTLVAVGDFTSKDGRHVEYAVLSQEDGSVVRVGLGYAVLRSQWQEKAPLSGDLIFIARAAEAIESQGGRSYYPFALVVKRAGEAQDESLPF